MNFKKVIDSNLIWLLILAILIFSIVLIIVIRDGGYPDGKDLRVGLFGVEQILNQKSPYQNPTDPSRPLFRYAPGFALLQYPISFRSRMAEPYQFKNLAPSIVAWYLIDIAALALIGILLFKLIPAPHPETAMRNLKLAFLLALPWMIYEVANGQNKIVALLLIVASLFFFERNRLFWSAFFLNWAITVYVPLAAFILYFLLKYKKRFLINLILSALLVFIILPSLVWGFHFNINLLRDWYGRCLKPFVFAQSYEPYADVRTASQSLPSAIGRWFVTGRLHHFIYRISPVAIHWIIKSLSFVMVSLSSIAVWRQSQANRKGLEYSLFLILALLIPQYCLCYTWVWLIVIYFALFNYLAYPENEPLHRNVLSLAAGLLILVTLLFSFRFFQRLSVLAWGTFLLWAGIVFVLLRGSRLIPLPR